MGNFSRDPEARLVDVDAKHYVGIRVQQGVPLLDADLHLLEGMRRAELEGVGQWMLGNGVPVNSDGFRILPLANGAVGTVVLVSNTAGIGTSSLQVSAASTAAGKLGFDAANSSVTRTGDSPATLTSRKAEPFALANNDTLIVAADGGAAQTITFKTADFANIAAATAAEVMAKVVAAAAPFTARVGAGNDFLIRGGDGTARGAGRILVDGRLTRNERDVRYSEQPLYANAHLAAKLGVQPVAAITTPTLNETWVVYLHVFHHEVGRSDDAQLVDTRIGIETAVCVRREWAVRVAREADYDGIVAGALPGHSFYKLARLGRKANTPSVPVSIITDLRETDLALRREVAYRAPDGAVLVGSVKLGTTLTATRDAVRDLVQYLTTKFVDPSTSYLAGEVAGVEALGTVAGVTDHVLAVLNAGALGTTGALATFRQLLDAQSRFVDVWRDAVLPIVKGGSKVYENTFKQTLDLIDGLLTGPAPGGFVALDDALQAGDLHEAVRTQDRIVAELAVQVGRPVGAFMLKYLGSTTPTVPRNASFDVRYELSGALTPDDDVDATVFVDTGAGWGSTLRNADGSTPFALRFGPGQDKEEFLVSVRSPDVAVSETMCSVEVHSRKNPGVSITSSQKRMKIGNSTPPAEDRYAIVVTAADVGQAQGIYQVPLNKTAKLTFRVINNTSTSIIVKLVPSGSTTWTIVKGSGFGLDPNTIPANDILDFFWRFTPPNAIGDELTFTLAAVESANNANVYAELQVKLRSVAAV